MTTTPSPAPIPDQPYFDKTAYGNGPNDSVTDATENAAITHHELVLGAKTIPSNGTGKAVNLKPARRKGHDS